MGPLIGFVSVPRSAEILRPTGAFFSAVVESRAGADTWKVRIGTQSLIVSSTLDLVPGETLKLRMVSQKPSRWILQILPASETIDQKVPLETNSLMAAFLSRGLPLAAERLSAWTRWQGHGSGPSDREGWAASLEARGASPSDPFSAGLQPWLAWQTSLEGGHPSPPPEDDGYWDLWNTKKTPAGDSWLVQPLRWEYEGREDAGLLQAHYNPQRQAVDRWHLTASPAGIPFRLEANTDPGRLNLAWHFFGETDLSYWKTLAATWEQSLSSSDLQVTMRVFGRPSQLFTPPKRGIDVEA